jgi:hypothetical protein
MSTAFLVVMGQAAICQRRALTPSINIRAMVVVPAVPAMGSHFSALDHVT